MHPGRVARSRGGPDAARSRQSAGDVPPPVTAVLQQVQIDHTVVDLMIVDEYDRVPIGRPYLTIAIDVFSRCVPGFVVTQIGRAHVCTPVTNAHLVCRLLL